MTLRDTLGSDAERVHDQVNKLLDAEDGIIILIGPRQVTSYGNGFGLSSCQLELLSSQIEGAVRVLTPAPSTLSRRNVRDGSSCREDVHAS